MRPSTGSMKKSVSPSEIKGTVTAPASKSVMQRAAAAALLSDSPVTIVNPGRDEDSRSALGIVRSLGAKVAESDDRVLIKSGSAEPRSPLDCGESGLSLRLFTPVAALFDRESELIGRGSLLKRPAGVIESVLADLGAVCSTKNGFAPVTVRGPLRGGRARVDASLGSQFLTGLLMALPRAPQDSELEVRSLVSIPYIELTLRVLEEFQVSVERRDFQFFRIPGGQKYERAEYRVEGDWSGAAFLLTAAALAGPVSVEGLRPDSLQGDKKIVDVLAASGATVRVTPERIEAAPGELRAFEFDVTHCPDLAPPLVVLASRCRGESVIRGTERLAHKESNRAEVLVREFQSLGVDIRLEPGLMRVRGGTIRGGEADSHGDHRIAMALAVAGLAARDAVVIHDAGCVIKSYPDFFEDLRSLGGRVHE